MQPNRKIPLFGYCPRRDESSGYRLDKGEFFARWVGAPSSPCGSPARMTRGGDAASRRPGQSTYETCLQPSDANCQRHRLDGQRARLFRQCNGGAILRRPKNANSLRANRFRRGLLSAAQLSFIQNDRASPHCLRQCQARHVPPPDTAHPIRYPFTVVRTHNLVRIMCLMNMQACGMLSMILAVRD
jgi:hypothetical protein